MSKKNSVGEKITFSGRLTIRTAREQKKKLMEAYQKGGPLRLEIRDVETVDLSFLQMLCSLHRTALRDKKKLTLEPPVSPILRRTMNAVGFERGVSCAKDGGATCIWKMIAMDES